MDIPEHIAEKLVRLIKGERIPASSLTHPIITELHNEGVVQKQTKGHEKIVYYSQDAESLVAYIRNYYGDSNLSKYMEAVRNQSSKKLTNALVTLDLENEKRKTLDGFFVAGSESLKCQLNKETYIIDPPFGVFIFICDYKNFTPPSDATIVGIDHPGNFKRLAKLNDLLNLDKVLFVFKHSHSHDLIRWLEPIPNEYLHFCDLDFSSLTIYYYQYKKRLAERCKLFVPPDLNDLFTNNGSARLYDEQLQFEPKGESLSDKTIQEIVTLIHRHKKGVKQELK